MLCYLLHHFSMLGIRVAESFKAIGFIYGIGNTTGGFNAFGLEEFLSLIQCSIVHNQQVAMGFQIDFVDIQLTGDNIPG